MRQYFEGAWEQGNIELLDELLAADYVNHTPATPEMPTGPEGVKAVVSMFLSGMPDLKVVIEDMIELPPTQPPTKGAVGAPFVHDEQVEYERLGHWSSSASHIASARPAIATACP